MTYKILSLDGGGTWALLEALALEAIYGDLPGREILDQFDLVTGNSGGSIVLGGLLANYTPTQLRDLFLKGSSEIFRPLNIFYRTINALGFGAKWSTEGKQKGLEGVLGVFAATPMSALAAMTTAKIMIPAFEYERQRGVYFRSYTSSAHPDACDTRLSDAINASSTAPVAYFDWPSKAQDGTLYWDGAIAGYNNPVMAGVIEAITLGVRPADIRALTIGTGTYRLLPAGMQPPPSPEWLANQDSPNPLGDLRKLAGSITDDPPDAASYTAHVVLGNDPAANPSPGQPPASLVRLSVCLQPRLDGGQWGPPKPLTGDQFQQLGKLELDAIKPDDLRLLEQAGLLWLAGNIDNQPVRPNAQMLSQIGHDTFADGHAAWRVLAGLPAPPPTPVARP